MYTWKSKYGGMVQKLGPVRGAETVIGLGSFFTPPKPGIRLSNLSKQGRRPWSHVHGRFLPWHFRALHAPWHPASLFFLKHEV